MLDKLLKHLIQEMGTSGPSGLDLDSLLHHAAQFYHNDQQQQQQLHASSFASSSRPTTRIDDQYLRFLWKILIEQEGVIVGRVVTTSKPRPSSAAARPIPPALSATIVEENEDEEEPDEGISSSKGKGKEKQVSAPPKDDDDDDGEGSQLDSHGLPSRKKIKGALPGMKGKATAKKNSNKGDLFVVLGPEEYLGVKLDDLKEKYDGLRIALDGNKMFYVLTGKHPGHIKISEIIYQALSLIASTKEVGLDSIALGRHLHQDQKMVFYYTKSLLDLGLIAKFQVTAHASFTTNLVHVLYIDKNQEQIAYALLKENKQSSLYADPQNPFLDFPASMWNNSEAIVQRIVDGLNLRSRELIRTRFIAKDMGFRGHLPFGLRRSIQRTIRLMVEKGIVRRVKIQNINQDPNGRTGRQHRAIQLVQRSRTSSGPKMKAVDEENEEVVDDMDEEEEDGEGEGDAAAEEAEERAMEEEEKEQEASGSGGLVPAVEKEMALGEEEELVDGGELLGVSEEEAVPSTTLFKPAVEVSTSMPIERQIVQMVADSGSHGMTFTQISDKIKVTRRFLDTFVDRHCSRASAPPHLSHLNLVAVTDFLGKEKNLVVYTIENWLENCRKTGIPSDEVGYPSPAPQARGFLDLEPYQLWTKEATRGQWADSYIAGKIPGIKPWVQARGGSVRGRGPQSRQGLERRAMVPRGPHVQVARKSTGGPKTTKKAAKEAVKDDGPPVVDPAFLLNSKMKPLSEIPKDEDGKYIFTRITKGKGPGPPIIALLHQVFNGEVPTPQGKGKLEKLVRGANYYGIRIPDLVDDNYGEGIEVEMPEPLEGGPSKRKADEMKDESVAADGEDEEDAQPVLKKRKGPLQALDEDEDEIDSNDASSRNARAPTRTNIIPATPPPAPEDDEEVDQLVDDDGEMEPAAAAAVERIPSASSGLVDAPNDQLDVDGPSQPPSQPNLALPRLQSSLEDLVEVVIEVSKSPSPAPVPLPAPPPPPASKKRGPRPSTRTRASQIQDEEEEIASDLGTEAGPSSQKRVRYYQSDEPEEPEEKEEEQEEEEEEKEVVSKKAKGKQASRPYGKKIVAPRETRPKSNLDFARQKRDQYFLQWLKTEGGIFENSFNAPIVHQKYLEKIIAEAFAQGNDLRTKATLQDRRTWELTMGRLEEKQQIKTKTIAAETKSGEMMKTKIFYLFDTPQEELTKFVEDIAQNGPTSARTRKPDPANPQAKKQRQEAVAVVELDIGYEAPTLTTLRKLRESQLVAGLTMDDVLEVIDDDEEVRKLFLFEWRTASQQYGFVTGAFARAAIFHKELARILEEGSSDPAVVVSSEQRVLSLVDVIAELSLEIFLKLVSLSAPDEVLTLLLENEEGRQTKMRDVPKALRVSLMVDRRNTKEKFQRMIQTFYYFKLAIPLHPAAATNEVELEIDTGDDEEPLKFTKDLTVSFTHFQLLGQTAPLYALGNEKPTLTEVAPIGTTAEIGQFWTRMEELALNKSDAPVDPLPPSFADWPAKCDYPNRKSVSQPRSWLESYLLSPIQRAFLLRAVELSSDESPADDPTEIQRLSYLTAAPLDVVDTFVTSHIRKARRKQQQVEEIALKAEQRKKAKVEKETRTKLAAKRAEHRMQLEEDWSALARKYLGHHSIEMTDQLEKDLRGLRETELKDTTISRLNEAHIAEVVQEMLDTSPELRPQPGQAQSKAKGKGKAAAPPKIKSATPGEVEVDEVEEVPVEPEDDDEDEEEAMNERDPSTSPIPEPPPPPPKSRRRRTGGRRATTTDGQPPARSQSRSVDGRTVSPKKEEKPQALPRPKVPCYPVTAEDDYLIPNIGQGAPEPTPEPGRRRARLNYTEELDDLILDLGAILIARSTRVGCRLIWKSVSKVLPAILPTSIRVRFLKLREDPMTAAYLLRLQDAYIHLWKTHRKTEVLPDPTRHKFEEFDIVHHLKFFRKNISKEELRSNVFGAASGIRTTANPGRIGVPVPPLPSSVEDLATWNLRGVKSIKNYEYEDEWLWLHDRKKQVSEEQNEKRMCGLQFVIDRTEPEVLDPLPPAGWIAADPEMSTLAAALKMTLSCPEAIYDAEVAQTILVQQPRHHNILGKVTRALLNSSLITKRDFHTMSRSHHLNQQITKIDGPLSNKFFSESAKVEDQGGEEAILLEEETSNWPFTASEGSTAALLSLCSENRVELNVDRDDVSALTQRGVYNTRKLEDNEIELHVYGRISNPPVEEPEAVAPAPGDLEVTPAEYTDEEREEALLEVQDSPSIDVSEGALAFQESLEAAGEGGLNWDQLFALDNFEPPHNAARIVKLARAFCSSSPPLAFWTGYDQARLVSSAYVRTWSVVIPPPPSNLVEMPPRPPPRPEDWEDDFQAPGANDENEDEDEGEMDEERERSGSAPPRKAVSELREGEGTLVYPKRWLDLKGEIIPSSWEKSVRCVLGWIMARPTSEHHLRSSLATTFDRPEVTDILRFLLEEGIISRTLVEGMDAGGGERADAFFKIGDDAGEVGWLSTEQEKRIFFGVVEGRWLEGF